MMVNQVILMETTSPMVFGECHFVDFGDVGKCFFVGESESLINLIHFFFPQNWENPCSK